MIDLSNTFVVYRYIDNLTDKVFYVGKTKNLVERCKAHSKELSFARFNDFRIDYLICNDEPSALHYELAYIIKYKPCLNKYGNGDSKLQISNLPESWVEYYNTSNITDFNLQPKSYSVDNSGVSLVCAVLGMNDNLTNLKVLINIETKQLVKTFLERDLSSYYTLHNYLNINVLDSDDFYLEQLYSDKNKDGIFEINYYCLSPYSTICKYPYIWFDVSVNGNYLVLHDNLYGNHLEFEIIEKPYQNGVILDTFVQMNKISDSSFNFNEYDAKVIYDSVIRLRNKIEYVDLAFSLLDSTFTLPDLQRVYEVVLGRELYKTNFKGKLISKIKELQISEKSIVGNKKSKLYKYTGLELEEED